MEQVQSPDDTPDTEPAIVTELVFGVPRVPELDAELRNNLKAIKEAEDYAYSNLDGFIA
jgi:hypothetical protein